MAKWNVELPAALAEQIRHEAAIAAPRECCGLVEGLREEDLFLVTALHSACNLAAEDDRFDIDPRDQVAAVRLARTRGRQIIGCYHSHPGGAARPSPRDAAGAGQDEFLWLIAAGTEVVPFVYLCGGFAKAEWATSPP